MDFSTIEQKSEAFCHLVHPVAGPLYEKTKDGKPDYEKPIGIWHMSQESAPYRRKLEEQMRRESGKRQKKGDTVDLDKAAADHVERTASVCTRVSHIEHGGKEPKTEDDFIAFFEEHKWALKQVAQSLTDEANFF